MTDSKNRYVLKYRGPGKVPGTSKWKTRKVSGSLEARQWLDANRDIAWLPAFMQTNAWRPETLVIFGC